MSDEPRTWTIVAPDNGHDWDLTGPDFDGEIEVVEVDPLAEVLKRCVSEISTEKMSMRAFAAVGEVQELLRVLGRA